MSATAGWNPLDNPELYDTVYIGGVANPGICKLGALKRKNTWDVKKGKGTLGATITFTGRDPVSFSIDFLLWLPAHFVAWEAYRKQFDFDPTKKAVTAIGIFHPLLSDLGINAVVCEGIGVAEDKGKKLFTITVDLLEYFPPPKAAATGTPTGSKSSSDANKPPGTTTDPIADAQQKEIASLLKQAGGP